MNYIKINSSSGVVVGAGVCRPEDVDKVPLGPGEALVENVDPPPSMDTIYRFVDGQIVSTGQPLMPPHPYLTWDSATFQWVDMRDLDALKAAKWEEVKLARSVAEYGGFTWDGSVFDSDPLSQQKIIGASQLATLNPDNFSIDWTLKDNTVRTLTAAEMNAVGVALGQHVNAQYVKGRQLREQIEAATTKAEVEAIHW